MRDWIGDGWKNGEEEGEKYEKWNIKREKGRVKQRLAYLLRQRTSCIYCKCTC